MYTRESDCQQCKLVCDAVFRTQQCALVAATAAFVGTPRQHVLTFCLPCTGYFGNQFLLVFGVKNDRQAYGKVKVILALINYVIRQQQPQRKPIALPKLAINLSNTEFLSDATMWDSEYTPETFFRIWGRSWLDGGHSNK